MLEYLAKMAGKITPKELDDIYMVFDLSPENGAGEPLYPPGGRAVRRP